MKRWRIVNFFGNDLAVQPSLRNECGSLCLANFNCTHFSWGYRNNCYIKSDPKGLRLFRSSQQGYLCGYIPNRISSFDWREGEKGQITVADDCDFIGNDLQCLNGGKQEDCGGINSGVGNRRKSLFC